MRVTFLCLTALVILCSCKEEKPLVRTSIAGIALIPIPNQVDAREYGFLLDENTKIQVKDTTQLGALSIVLKNALAGSSFSLPITSNSNTSNVLRLDLVSQDSITNTEGYVLDVNSDVVAIAGSSPEGIFRGIQTFSQLLPVKLLTSETSLDSLVIPGVKIVDAPHYEYRGMMLDVARHFFSVQQVKRLIDQMASYKLNTLHLHLADDQGWRLEIKSWPKLTEIGGSTAVGGGKGGFYSQEDYKEIVAYASNKFITIIPEIDMPGHTNAALASYPELNCDGKSPDLYTGMRVGFSSLCVDKEITYTFIDDVIGELAAMTPGEYIHLGGDESHSTPQEDYNYFLEKAFEIVQKHGKKVMGWEDIQSSKIAEDMILQHWQNEETIIKGLKKGARVVLSPANRMYLDMKYTKESQLGLTWAGYVEVDSAYAWKPKTLFDGKYQSQILGLESPLWSETITTTEDIEFLAFPRLIGHAEIGWSKENDRDWNTYKKRLAIHYDVLNAKKINFYKSAVVRTAD